MTERQLRTLLGRLLRPALRFCLKRSLKIQDIVAVLKAEFIALAHEELRAHAEAPSISRVSAITGLQRKDIQKYLERDDDGLPGAQSVITRVVGMWSVSPEFVLKSGKPRNLSYRGLQSEFAQLVFGVNSDLSHLTVLAELERLKLVERHGDRVGLVQSSVPIANQFEGFGAAGQDIDDLFRAVEVNLSNPESTPHLHVRTSFDNIPESALPVLQKRLFALGKQAHAKARTVLSRYDRDVHPGRTSQEKRYRITLGTFSYREEYEEKHHGRK